MKNGIVLATKNNRTHHYLHCAMRTLLLLFALHTTPLFLVAQPLTTPEYSRGRIISSTQSDLNLCSISEWKNYKLVVRSNYKGDATRYTVEVFDHENNRAEFSTHKFTIPESDRLSFVEVVSQGDVTYLLVSKFSASEKATILFAYPVTEKGILEDERKEIDRLPAYNAGNTGRFRVNVSPDHQFLVVLRENIYDKAKNETIALHRYDTDLNQVWTKTHAFSILSKNQTVNIPFVNNKGDLYLIKKDRDKETFKYYILAAEAKGTIISEKPLQLGNIFISDIRAALLQNGNLGVAGFYSTQGYDSYEGSFYFAFDSKTGVAVKHNESLNSEILTLFMAKKDASKSGTALFGFNLHHLIAQENGGMYLIAEKTQQVTEKTAERYTYEDLLILNYDEQGNIKWGKSIRKKQETWGDDGKWSSYNYFLYNDTLNILFNKVIFDDQLTKTGKKKKADEFGESTGYGTNWARVFPNGQIQITPLTGMHQGTVPLTLNPEILYSDTTGKVFVVTEGHLKQHHLLLGMKFYNRK